MDQFTRYNLSTDLSRLAECSVKRGTIIGLALPQILRNSDQFWSAHSFSFSHPGQFSSAQTFSLSNWANLARSIATCELPFRGVSA